MDCDILIVGGGTGGVAAALALMDKGLSVVLTEETDWLGGQLTSQIVPPDEHPWIEKFGCTRRYRELRDSARDSYRLPWKKLSDSAQKQVHLNPGGGWVSRICCEPTRFRDRFWDLVNSNTWRTADQTLLKHVPVSAEVSGSRVVSVLMKCDRTGRATRIKPKFVLDATELGDLLPLTGTDYVVGAESKNETGEPHALDGLADPSNIQSFTWCAAIGYDPRGDHTINKPYQYDFWKQYVPAHWTGNLLDLTFPNVRTGEPMTLPLFDDPTSPTPSPVTGEGVFTLFSYRQIVDPTLYRKEVEAVTVMNWPQNDYMLGHVIDVDDETRDKHYEGARQLTFSVLYWLQTELGFKGLRLRPDITGTADGLAKAPYHRESRRIKSLRTVKEQDVVPECNPGCSVAPDMWDSVGVGAYRIDLHPGSNGAETIDISCLPFQIPLGALICGKTENLIPACKNIGTTHITNGCYRLHPVEWTIGEAAGLLAYFCLEKKATVQEVYGNPEWVTEYQDLLVIEGFELSWPTLGPL